METTRKEGSLYTRFDGGLAILEFGHPASNSLNSVLLDRLCQELEDFHFYFSLVMGSPKVAANYT